MDHSHGDLIKTQGSLPLPDMIVWDMDGTLLNSNAGRFVNSDNESKARVILETLDRTYKAARSLKNMIAPNFHINPSTKSRLLSLATKTYEDTLETLESIHHMGITQAIASNNSRTAIGGKVLTHFHLKDTIEASMFLEDMNGLKKPHPDIMQALMETTNMPEDATIWVVGDRPTDMRFAKNANNALTQNFYPIAMGHDSSAASFLRLRSNKFDAYAVVSCPMEVSVMAAMDPRLMSYDAPPDTNSQLEP